MDNIKVAARTIIFALVSRYCDEQDVSRSMFDQDDDTVKLRSLGGLRLETTQKFYGRRYRVTVEEIDAG